MTVDELKKEKIWVCWKYVQKDGKSTKRSPVPQTAVSRDRIMHFGQVG